MARGKVVVVCLLAGKTENSDESLLLHSKTYTAARRLRWVALALRKNWTSVQIFARCNCSLIEISEFLFYPVGSWQGDAVVEAWAWCVQFEFILNLKNIATLLLFILIYLIMAWCLVFMKVICWDISFSEKIWELLKTKQLSGLISVSHRWWKHQQSSYYVLWYITRPHPLTSELVDPISFTKYLNPLRRTVTAKEFGTRRYQISNRSFCRRRLRNRLHSVHRL